MGYWVLCFSQIRLDVKCVLMPFCCRLLLRKAVLTLVLSNMLVAMVGVHVSCFLFGVWSGVGLGKATVCNVIGYEQHILK